MSNGKLGWKSECTFLITFLFFNCVSEILILSPMMNQTKIRNIVNWWPIIALFYLKPKKWTWRPIVVWPMSFLSSPMPSLDSNFFLGSTHSAFNEFHNPEVVTRSCHIYRQLIEFIQNFLKEKNKKLEIPGTRMTIKSILITINRQVQSKIYGCIRMAYSWLYSKKNRSETFVDFQNMWMFPKDLKNSKTFGKF
jgi:hypothetical protein